MKGRSADQFNFLREKLLKILSHVEAKIDFPDEDLPNDILKEIKKSSDEASSELFLISFKISFGKSSSGKSIFASTCDKIFKSFSLKKLN